MWIFLGVLAVAVLLYFLLHDTPADRLRKAEIAIRAGDYSAAIEQINWLFGHNHASAASVLGRLHLIKAQVALQKDALGQALTELDTLYAVRRKYPAADQVLLAAVEKESGDVLTVSIEKQAKAAETARNWSGALECYESGLERARKVAVLNGQVSGKLQAGVVNCHDQMFRLEVQPKLNAAASALSLGKYDEAEKVLNGAESMLRGPFPNLREQAAAELRPVVQAQLLVVQQARMVAEATRLLVQARQVLDTATHLTLPQLNETISTLSQAKAVMAAATKAGMPTHSHAAALGSQVLQFTSRALRCRGEHYEFHQQWPQAHTDYEAAKSVYQQLNQSATVATMQLRQSIVAIKSCKGEVVTDAGTIRLAEEKVRLDMAYRAAVSYLQAGDYQRASLFIPHLEGYLPEATALANAAKKQRLQALRVEIERVSTLAQDELAPFDALQQLHRALPDLATRTAVLNPVLGRQLTDLLPYVFGRLLTVGLAQGQLMPLLELLTSQPNYHTKSETLKNVGIVCLRLAVSQQLTLTNFKHVVALWLTALHTNEVLLASLESTSWDDDLTFTLDDSLGVRSMSDLPDNVNHSAASESNISLGEAQRNLMRTFESAIHSIEQSSLQTRVSVFYDQEKTALTNIIGLLNEEDSTLVRPCIITPFAAAELKLSGSIIQALLARYNKNANEELLNYALPYQTTPPQPLLVSYQAALELEKKATSCFASPRRTNLQALPALLKTGVAQLKSYPKLQSRLLLRLMDEVKSANKEEPDGQLVTAFEALIAAFPAHEPLKVLGAHHLCDWCISSLDEDKMDNTTALERLAQGWSWAADDQRLAANLCILFGMLCRAPVSNGQKQNLELALLEKVQTQAARQQTRALKQAVASELVPMQQDIFKMLREAKINVDALISAANIGYSTQYTADGIAMGKKLAVLRKMTALAD